MINRILSIPFYVAIFCLSSVGFATENANPQFTLRLEAPATERTCAAHADALGRLLAQQTAVTLVGTNCKSVTTVSEGGSTFNIETLILTYSAATPVTSDKTYFSGSSFLDHPDRFRGIFASYGECVSNLSTQTSAFAEATGLPVFTAYCQHSGSYGDSKYVLTVESFGRAKAQLYVYDLYSVIPEQTSSVRDAVLNAIAAKGGKITLANQERIFYFNPAPISVRSMELGYFYSESDCASQIGMASSIFTQYHATNVSVFCAPFMDAKYFRLNVVATDAASIEKSASYASAHYRGIADCLDDIARVATDFKARGSVISGGICVPTSAENSDFTLEVYVPRI